MRLQQEPGAEPLMLDRFDARWMLDLPDFKKGEGSSLPAKLMAEVSCADYLAAGQDADCRAARDFRAGGKASACRQPGRSLC